MRILTVRQPWAWAIIHGGKNVENRVRNVAGSYRGPVAIHVARKYATEGLDLPALDDAADAWCATNSCATHPWLRDVGKVIGVVDLVDVHFGWTEGKPCSPWGVRYVDGNGQWHLELANPRPLATPIPARGRLGLWRPDQDLLDAIQAQNCAGEIGGES